VGAAGSAVAAKPAATDAPAIDLSAPELYLNRELTWLAFEHRVLGEAETSGIRSSSA
jgi:polyphosphate kinase